MDGVYAEAMLGALPVLAKMLCHAANAGAIGGHIGRSHAQVRALPNLETKKYPGLFEDRVFSCIKAWQ